MSIIAEGRASDSPYVETITRGRTESDGSPLRPAEICWHMVLRKLHGNTDLLVVGPWTSAGVISYAEGTELLWIKFKPGTFLPHLSTRRLLDRETVLPAAAGKSFWLSGSTWQSSSEVVWANFLRYSLGRSKGCTWSSQTSTRPAKYLRTGVLKWAR